MPEKPKKLSFKDAEKLGGQITLQGKLYMITKIAQLDMTSEESFKNGEFVSTSRIHLIAELSEYKQGVVDVQPAQIPPEEVREILKGDGN